jgi:hypothetical protein
LSDNQVAQYALFITYPSQKGLVNMFSKRTLIGILIALAVVVIPVFAGNSAITSFTANCTSAVVGFFVIEGRINLTITDVDTKENLFSDTRSAPPNTGTFNATFNSPLANGTRIQATINQSNSAIITVNCSGGDGDGYTEMCDDGRTNTNLCEPVAIYPIETDDGIGINIWDARRTGTEGELLYISAEQRAQLSTASCIMGKSKDGFVIMVWLGDALRVYAGPDDENKTFIFIYKTFPSLPTFETFFGSPQINLPACFD